MAKIQEKHKFNFTPTFTTRVNGQTKQVTIKELESNPIEYINSPVGYMYEDEKGIRADLSRRVKATPATVLDMNRQKRGYIFDQERQSEKVAAFKKKAEKSRKKLQALRQRNAAAKIQGEEKKPVSPDVPAEKPKKKGRPKSKPIELEEKEG